MFIAKVEQSKTLPSCFSFHKVNKCLFSGVFSDMLFTFCVFLLVILVFTMASKYSAKMLPGEPKRKTVVTCITDNMRVLDRLHSGMSYRALCYEFTVNESTM